MCKKGRVSQEDDSDQPFRENYMREKYPIKKFKIAKCKYAKIRSFQKEIIQMKTEKVIQNIEKRYPGRFCEKRNIHKRWYIDEKRRTSIRDDIFKENVRHRKDAK